MDAIKAFRVGNEPPFRFPDRHSEGAAGLDIYSNMTVAIEPGDQVAVSTGVGLEIPTGWYGQILDRSGIAFHRRVTTRAGVIDSDYRGEIRVILVNESDKMFIIEPGMRIAQIVIIPCLMLPLVVVDDPTSATKRGAGGFGSTGL